MALLLIGALLVLSLVTTSAIVFWFFYALTVLVVVSYFWTKSAADNLRIRRTLANKWATTGDAIDEEILLSNLGRLPILLVELDDQSSLPRLLRQRGREPGRPPDKTMDQQWQGAPPGAVLARPDDRPDRRPVRDLPGRIRFSSGKHTGRDIRR